MRLDSIQLQNYRCHRDLLVKFSPKFNVLVGANGSGKTAILKGIRDTFAGLTHFFPLKKGNLFPLQNLDDARISTTTINDRVRFEPNYPVTITAICSFMDNVIEWNILKPGSIDNPQIQGITPGQIWASQRPNAGLNDEADHRTLPIVVFYGANRQWPHANLSELQAVTERYARADGYERWWDPSIDASSLLGWMISKSLERLQAATETGLSFDQIFDDELSLVNSALADAVDGMKSLRYDMRQKSLLVEWRKDLNSNREPTLFENLSDGQRSIISLIADIARRICLLNPHLGPDALKSTPGVVLIDELDMHLHPKWQRAITNGLQTAFPSVQFIVASHSPQVLGELKPHEIILLSPSGVMHPKVSYGVDSNRVLEEIMGATARPTVAEDKLAQLFLTLERNQLDEARTQLAELKEIYPGLAELTGAAALIKRKELFGK